MSREVDFTRGNMAYAIVRFSIPLITGELLQNLYNSVDAFVVGNLVGRDTLAAVTVCSVITNMLVNFFNGMSVGTNIVIAKAHGRGKQEDVQRMICVTFSFGVVLGVIFSLLGVLSVPWLLQAAGAQEVYYIAAQTYLRIYLAGLMFTVIFNNAAGILRALGRSELPFRILLISCGINVTLDLLLTDIFKMGIAGVGFATAVSQGVSAVLIFRAINHCIDSNCLNFHQMLSSGKTIIAEMLSIGAAAGVQSALIGFSNIFVTRYINRFNTAAVAGIGIAQRIDRFVIMPAKAFGITMTTCIGQNLGAGKHNRIAKGEKSCVTIALTVTIVLSLIVYVFAKQCVALFNPDPEVILVGTEMMHILAPTFWIMALREVILGILRACGYSLVPTVLSLIGMVGVRQIFLAVKMHQKTAIESIYYCYPAAWAATLLLLLLYAFFVRTQLRRISQEYERDEKP